MKKHSKKIFILITCVLIAAMLASSAAFATGWIELDRKVKLTVHFVYDKADIKAPKDIKGSTFKVYKVADTGKIADFTVTSDFGKYVGKITGMDSLNANDQDTWADLAFNLASNVEKDGVAALKSGTTGDDGRRCLGEFEPGLYLVTGTSVTLSDGYKYTPYPFLTMLPQLTEDDEWNYDVEAFPKKERERIPDDDDDTITRKALKKWDDEGFEDLRPSEVTVNLLRDGKVKDTKVLNEKNGWSCTWEGLSPRYDWKVTEDGVDGYSSLVTKKGITFVVTNTKIPEDPDNPGIPGPSPEIPCDDPPVQKIITGDKPAKDSTFTFVLTAADPEFPMPDGSYNGVCEMTITGEGSREFGNIYFYKPGIYGYTVSEKYTGAAGYTYDNTVYSLTYEVTENNGVLTYKRTIIDSSDKVVDAVVFTNNYKTPSLPQTGQPWLPVCLLLAAGAALVTLGRARRKN